MSLLPAKFQPEAIPTLGALVREAIAPKPDPIKAFETGKHSQPKWIDFDMAVKGSDQTVQAEYSVSGKTVTIRGFSLPTAAPVAPPSAKFKVGDRVRPTYKCAGWKDAVVTLVAANGVGFWIDGKEWFDFFTDIELLPPEPKAEDGGWIEWKGVGEPSLSGRGIEVRFRDQDTLVIDSISLGSAAWAHGWGAGDIVAYRVIA